MRWLGLRQRVVGGCCLAVLLLAAAPVWALDWEVRAFVFATEKPNGPGSSYVWGRGTHQLLVTNLSVVDQVLLFRYKVTSGDLRHEGAGMDACTTSWKWSSSESYIQECKTYSLLVPCQNGTWSGTTTGKLSLHPDGGTMFTASAPKLLNCACS